MSKRNIRKVLNEEQIQALEVLRAKKLFRNEGRRYRMTKDEWSEVKGIGNSVETETSDNDYKGKKAPLILSAWSSDGYMMDIDEYCECYSLPRKDISSYKLISHTGTPFYNIVFRENIESSGVDFEGEFGEIIERVLTSSKPINVPFKLKNSLSSTMFTRLIYSDAHLGMDTDSEGTSMYPTEWNKDSILESMDIIAKSVLENRRGDILYIDELGDFLDGYNAETVRGGHKLPQNMTNEEAFELGLRFKVGLIDRLINHFEEIRCNNICNDNHAGSFGAVLNISFKRLIEVKYSDVKVNNIFKFIGHYKAGNHTFVLSHGKDKKSLKFGFKPQLDSKQIEKIDHYLRENDIYRESKFIEFSKGDSHQFLLDYSTAQYFDYMNYPALSPSSEWVQSNFKRGCRGFVIQQVSWEENTKNIIPKFL